jgi:sugar/nucleoside kinase (ribokinase family)
VGIITAAGDEPEARAGLHELRGLATTEVQPAARSITFRHAESEGLRILTLLERGSPLRAPARTVAARGVLYAPVAAELGAELGIQVDGAARSSATLQGWLRSLDRDRPVTAVGLDAIPPALVERLGALDLLVASEEDLVAVAADPTTQLAALRATFGPHATLALTLGADGAMIDAPGELLLVVVPKRVISGARMTGAGDAFAAVLTASLARGTRLRQAAEEATAAAVAYLDR